MTVTLMFLGAVATIITQIRRCYSTRAFAASTTCCKKRQAARAALRARSDRTRRRSALIPIRDALGPLTNSSHCITSNGTVGSGIDHWLVGRLPQVVLCPTSWMNNIVRAKVAHLTRKPW